MSSRITQAPPHEPANENLGEVLDETLAPELDERQLAPNPATPKRLAAFLAIAAVVLIGLNLRVGVASAAALFHDLQLLLGYGPLVAATLPSIPVVCFAVAGAATSWLTRLVGLERAIRIVVAAPDGAGFPDGLAGPRVGAALPAEPRPPSLRVSLMSVRARGSAMRAAANRARSRWAAMSSTVRPEVRYSGVALARDAYAKSQASPADRKAADDLRRANRRAADQARYRARKKGTAA